MFSHAIKHINDSSTGGLPYDAEVEYLEATGTQYIDTGFQMTSDDMRFECEMMRTGDGSTANFFYGYRFVDSATYTGNMRAFFVYGSSPVGRLAIRYGTAADNSTSTLTLNQKVSMSFNGQKLLIDGVEYATMSGASSSPTYGNMYLFDCNTSTYYRSDVSRFIGRFYSFKIWQGNQLVRDFIPVRVGNEYCLYDRANPTGGDNGDGLYHNKGTDAFLGGVDQPSAGTKFLVSRTMGSAKPYDAEVEYVESNGTQYVDTGVNADSSLGFKIKGTIGTEWGHFIGAMRDSTYLMAFRQGGHAKVQRGSLSSVSGPSSNATTPNVYFVDTITNSCGVDSVSTTRNTGAFDIKANFYLFAGNRVLSSQTDIVKISGRLWYAQLWVSGTLVRDFQPVRIGQVGYLYDKVSGELFGSATATPLIAGPDKCKIKPILKHYDIATSYLINECTGARPTKTNAVFPSGTYEALDYTPVAYQHYDAEVEYLECSGTQWVDTQWYPGKDAASGSCYYLIDFMQPSTFTGSPEMEVWGCWGGGTNWNCWANKNEASLTVISGSRAANTRVVMGRALSGSSSKPIGLFAWQGLSHPCTGVKIYSYQVRRSSATGVLLQDFIPVRVGTAGYFYDRVSGKLFGNGDLAVGADVGGSGAGRRFTGWGTIPYYDSEVDYVECTGTQYLDTGLYIDPTKQHIKSTCHIQFTGTGRQLMGWNASDTCYWGVANGGTNYEVGGTTTTTTSTTMPKTGGVDTLVWEHFTNANQTLTLKGSTDTVISRAKAAGLPGEYYILHLAGSYRFIGKLYGYTIEIDDQLVRDYVPVRCGTVGMLYDKVSNQLFYSSSTDPFIPGNDISPVTVLPTNQALTSTDSVVYTIPMVYAQWQKPTTVAFDATTNGGEMPSGWVSPDYYEGQPYGTLPTPTKSGETFLGWFTSGGTRVTTSSTVTSGTLTARYAAVTWGTTYSCTTTSSYKNTGIYAANRYSASDPIVVDWGDGTLDVVYGNISQLAHTYPSATTYTVKISDNISTFCPSYNNSTWYQTTSQNQYTFKKVLTLSSKVTQLSAYAFYYCSAMTDAIIPSGATSIPTYCFYYCTQLKSSSVQLPSTVTSIGSYAFYNCSSSNFSSITIPAACTSIGSYAFGYCYYLHPVFEAGSATLTLNTYSFAYCFYQSAAVGTIDLSPRKITSIPNYCFYYCRYLKGITWPQGLTSIGGYAFRYCFYYAASTGTVKIPEGVTSISSNYAFGNCPYLTAVTLPSTLTNLNNYTFYYCTRLATITSFRSTAPTVYSATFGNSNTYYTGRTSYSSGTNKLRVPAGATGYNASYWSSVLLNSTKCGFTLEEMP